MRKISFIFLFLAFLFSYANEKALIEGFSYMCLKTNDIGVDMRSFEQDAYSMALCSFLLANPEKSEFETEILLSKIRELHSGRFYKYADKRETSKKKISKPDFSFLKTKEAFNSMNFLSDTLISDSAYYSQVRFFLNAASRESAEEKLFYSMLEAIDYIISLDDSSILSLCMKLKDEYKDYFDIIIGSSDADTYHLYKGNKLIIDLGGDDVYMAFEEHSLAGGNGGLSGIVDLSGNDEYQGKGYDIGCGINGAGFIDDRDGNDRYSSSYCSIGAGFNGLGFVLDRGGNDEYISNGLSQGFGFTKGAGIIYDIKGNDSYLSVLGMNDHREEGYHSHLSQGFGYGVRDIASGGVGMIVDDCGDDIYSGEYFVQGSSYWHGLGILYDTRGNDIYRSRRYSQGAGTHFTVGLLFDREGRDLYHSWGVSQGCGHDFSFGMLSDYSGDDLYYSNWLSQGAGNANGAGVLIDFAGDDIYRTDKEDCQGWANPDRGTFSYGMLFDMRGIDSFNRAEAKSEVKTKMGVLIDKD
ncbi:MAG: hypothetical protein AB7T10_01385 [bacterium]